MTIKVMKRFICILILILTQTASATTPSDGAKPAKGRTSGYWVTISKVVDGDTYWANGVKYREVDMDTPETNNNPKHGYKCDAERRLGELAKSEAEAVLLNRKIWIKPTGKWDRYDRPLVKARFGQGNWYGEHMIKMRLAAKWQGRKHRWCEELEY